MTTAPRPRAIGYARQSKDSPRGIQRQREDVTAEAERRGAELVKIIEDNEESADSKRKARADYRPGYGELVREMQARAVDLVIAQDQDRLLRDVREGEDLIDLVEQTKVRVVFTRAGEVDLATVDGRMQVRLKAVIARQETEKKAERQRRQQRQAAEQGQPPVRRCFGYRNENTRDATGRVVSRVAVEDPEEAKVVRRAFAMLADQGEEPNLRPITDMVNASGLPSTRGKGWHRTMTRTLLLNPRYAGLRYLRGERVGRGAWPALVTEDEWKEAVRVLADPARQSNRTGTARKHLGSGLFRCGVPGCGSDVKSTYRESGSRVYTCRSRKHLSRAAEAIDAYVIDVITTRLRKPDVRELLAADADVPELGELREKEADLRARLARKREQFADDLISAETLAVVEKRLTAELDGIHRKMVGLRRESRLATLAAVEDPGAAWLALDLAARRAVLDALAVVTVLPGKAGRPGGRRFDPDTVRVDWRG